MSNETQSLGTQPLPVGHELLWYKIEEILGHGGFGMTYLATDTNLNRQVAIKEYLPSMFAFRSTEFDVNPLSTEHEKNYTWGLSSFLNEAKTLAKFKHRNIVQVQTVFEANNTAYMVMEYEHGESLDQAFKSRIDQLNQSFFENLLFPVMEGLQAIHDAGFIHRDIKPGNLYLRTDSSPVLIDFGSARQTSQQETSEMTTLVSQGYTPLEQYSSNFGEQGPWTDIYSLAASVYHGITGKRPEDALNRSASALSSNPDPLPRLLELAPDGYSDKFCHAIDCALELKPAERPRHLSDWATLFETNPEQGASDFATDVDDAPYDDDATRLQPPMQAMPAQRADATSHQESADLEYQDSRAPDISDYPTSRPAQTTQPSKGNNFPLIAGSVLLIAALAGGGWWFTQQNSKENSESPIVTATIMESLPQPPASLEISTPQDIASVELDELQALATVYTQAINADPESQQGKEGLSYVLGSYTQLADLVEFKSNDNLKKRLITAINELPIDTSGAVESIRKSLNNAEETQLFSQLEPLLDNPSLTHNERQNLIYGLASLKGEEKSTALSDARVSKLNRIFKASIVTALENSQFEKASRMTGLALLVDPQDEELQLIKNHLLRESTL